MSWTKTKSKWLLDKCVAISFIGTKVYDQVYFMLGHIIYTLVPIEDSLIAKFILYIWIFSTMANDYEKCSYA